jgi:hypothetical protein
MLSMPPAIPTSICPTAIEFAILVIALRPDAQARFTVLKDVVVAFEPPSSASTVPMHMSSIFAGSRLGNLEIVALRT